MKQRRSDNQMLRRFVSSGVTALSDYEIEVIVCTNDDHVLDGDVWDMQGIDLTRYLAHPVVLWDHDMSQPIGRASDLTVTPEKITAKVTFPDEGISPKADEIRKMVKSGMISGVSGGILPVQSRPLDPKNPRSGNRITKSILLEFSICAVPADASSGVTARSNGGTTVADPTVPTDDEKAAAAAARKRALAVLPRGLYSVGQLAYILSSLGYQADSARYEAEIEGDGSKVPAMLASVLHDLGDALIAMTIEEVGELLAGHDVDVEADDDDLDPDERAAIAGTDNAALRAFRRGVAHAKQRAGKKLSADTVRCIRNALDEHAAATADVRAAVAKQKKALSSIEDLLDGTDDGTGDGNPEATTGNDDDEDAAAERALRARAALAKARALELTAPV